MKKISIAIALLVLVIVYQLMLNIFFVSMDENKFKQSLGVLSDEIKPYERDYLKILYKRIDKFEKERVEKNALDFTYKEENLRTFYNKALNRLTDKYLSEDEAVVFTLDEQNQKINENNQNKTRIDGLFARLEGSISENDFYEIKDLYSKYQSTYEYSYLDDIETILSTYDEINTDILVEYLLDPIDIKAYFKLSSKKNLLEESLWPIIENQPSETEIELYEKIWSEIKFSLGEDLLSSLDYFLVYSDGKDESLAYVNYLDDKASRWYMAIDIEDSINIKDNTLNDEFYFTIVHELAHIITLNDTQAIYNSEPVATRYFEDNISMKENSYLNDFYIRFWTDFFDEARIIQKLDNEDIRYKFFLRHENSFVTDYAATNASEDIAESFAYFVINDKPKGNEVWEQKVRFFYEFEELVKIRNTIRNKLQDIDLAA